MRAAFIILLSITTLHGQKKVNYNYDYTKASKSGCQYALVFRTDSNIRLDFYDCRDKLVKTQHFTKHFNPRKDHVGNYLHGEAVTYFPDGKVSGRCSYQSGARHGDAFVYFQDGRIAEKCFYSHGAKQGEAWTYYPNGQLASNCLYRADGKYSQEKTYAPDGTLIGTGNWKNGKKSEGIFFDRLRNGYSRLDIYSDYVSLKRIYLDSLGDTASVYEYYMNGQKKLLKHCIQHRSGKVSDTFRFKPDYRESLFKPDTAAKKPSYKSVEDSLMNLNVSFLGGNQGIGNFISDQIRYPENCKEKGITGEIMVGFVVGREGNIVDAFTNGTGHPDLQAEALNVITISDGMWVSGLYNGKPRISYCRIPIQFLLE